MEQLILILLIALISVINWIVQKSREKREKRKLEKRADATGEPVGKVEPAEAPPMQGEITMRRLREALGLPEDAEPPVIRKRTVVETPSVPPPLPAPSRKPVIAPAPSTPRRFEHRKVELPHLVHRTFELPHRRAKPIMPVEVARPPSRVRELLGSPGGLRDAVVLSEILGRPKGLRGGEFRP